MKPLPLSIYLLLVSPLVLLFGCGPGNPRREITGKITFKSKPLDNGVIEFHPLQKGEPGKPSTLEATVITNGEYKIVAEAGLVPGKYKVLISSGDNIDPTDPNGIPGPTGNYVSKDRIPAEYNTASKVEVEVKDSGKNEFNFDIP